MAGGFERVTLAFRRLVLLVEVRFIPIAIDSGSGLALALAAAGFVLNAAVLSGFLGTASGRQRTIGWEFGRLGTRLSR